MSIEPGDRETRLAGVADTLLVVASLRRDRTALATSSSDDFVAQGHALLSAFHRIRDASVRSCLIDLATLLANAEGRG